MKGNKIIATLIVLAMLLSTLVVFNQLNIIKEASAQPGVDYWGDATMELVYGTTYTSSQVKVNTSEWAANGTYYLYYPNYWSVSPGIATNFSWDGPYEVGTEEYPVRILATQAAVPGSETFDALNTGGNSISFPRAGLWIFDEMGTNHSTPVGYLWVNASNVFDIASVPDIPYGAEAEITITVTEDGNNAPCMISVLDQNNVTVFHNYTQGTATLDQDFFPVAGDYTIKAYRDLDKYGVYYYYGDEDGAAYNESYGNGASFPIDYGYADVGPWDPPEKMADEVTFSVTTAKPNIVLTNTSLYWGFEARIDINVTDSDGVGLNFTTNPIMLKYGSKYVDFSGFITNLDEGNYAIEIPRFDAGLGGWSDLATAVGDNVNGTWKVVFGYDSNDDGTYEWNNTASFTVRSANPPVQIVIVNDGSGDATDKEVNVPEYVSPNGEAATIDIVFDIFGRSIIDEYRNAYYGDDADELDGVMDNVTIEGDILYSIDETTLVYNYDALHPGRWTATVTPTKPGGTITFSIDWPGDENGTATTVIDIVNGTFVTSAVDEFTVGSDYNLTVTVTDMDGAPVKNAAVYLMWEDESNEFNYTVGSNKVGNGYNGEYTFWIQPHDKDSTTPAVAPQNITVAARWYEGFWGYTKVIMARNHNLMVNITPTTAYAGDSVEYDITVSLIGGGHPDADGLSVALFNETGEYVTGDDEWYVDNDYEITNEEIILSGGTYHIAAMNDTCDSKGYNATLIVTPYTVTSTPSILAWIIDDATNMTFQVTPVGNGTLTLYNMTSSSEAAIENDSTQISIENGVGTLDEVNASTLGNVTFSYTPDGGADRAADGLLRVTTATATPDPATIYIGEASVVTITVTHPATGTPLEDVRVGLDHGMLLNETILAKLPTDLFTDVNGKVEFSITADASGEITIYIENETDPDNEFVINSAARKPMTISLNPSVDEGKTFTVEAKSNGVLITGTTVTFTFNGQTWPTTTGVATLTAPSVSTSLTYPITATAEGYTPATGAIIMVVNIPKLIIAIAGEVKAGQTFTLTVADDTGSPVIGATITLDGKTYTSGAGGVVTITAPSTEGTYPVTATFPGYETLSDNITVLKGGGIPGFELLTLIAAIGVAFLLLRRRRN